MKVYFRLEAINARRGYDKNHDELCEVSDILFKAVKYDPDTGEYYEVSSHSSALASEGASGILQLHGVQKSVRDTLELGKIYNLDITPV